MKHQSTHRPRADPGSRSATPSDRTRVTTGVRQQLDDIYFQFDDQLTRMAQIQLQFDRLRSKIRPL